MYVKINKPGLKNKKKYLLSLCVCVCVCSKMRHFNLTTTTKVQNESHSNACIWLVSRLLLLEIPIQVDTLPPGLTSIANNQLKFTCLKVYLFLR